MHPEHHNCRNCHNNFKGSYCNYCGEKAFTAKDKSIKHLLEETLHFFTHFEGKLPLTLKTIVACPGKFSLDYCNGIRKKYFKPISFFLLLVVLYLLFPRLQIYIFEINLKQSYAKHYMVFTFPDMYSFYSCWVLQKTGGSPHFQRSHSYNSRCYSADVFTIDSK